MAEAMFELQDWDLKHLKKFYKNAPKQFGFATARVLTNHAGTSRLESLGIIDKKMMIRNRRFVQSRLRTKGARGSTPINRQFSMMGSIEADRFSGWVEQETGQRTKRKRVGTQEARGGTKEGQIKHAHRFKKQFLTIPDDVEVKNAQDEQHRITAAIIILRRKNYRKPFLIRSHGKRLSLYKFKGAKRSAFKLQTHDPVKGGLQPARVRWMRGGVGKYFKETDLRKLWAGAIREQLDFMESTRKIKRK